jgi:hypothetical protein
MVLGQVRLHAARELDREIELAVTQCDLRLDDVDRRQRERRRLPNARSER